MSNYKAVSKTFRTWLLVTLCGMSGTTFATSVYLECSLTSTTTNTSTDDVRTIEREGVILELINEEGATEVRTQSVSIPLNIKISEKNKEWRSGDAFVYDENKSTGRRYNLQRTIEDPISVTHTVFELDRSTGHLIQETTQELGEGMMVVNITQGICMPTKRHFAPLF